MTLTVAQVAGLINVGVVLLQFTFPLVLIFILVGVTTHENNAVTWSVTGRLLGSTWWPSILQTDAAATKNVSRRVVFISLFSTLGLILLAVASIITPLGLFVDQTRMVNDVTDFAYVRDLSPIGLASPPRDEYNISRRCGWLMDKPCPGQYHGYQWSMNATGGSVTMDGPDDYISTVMPDNLTRIFSSGRSGDMKTVATPFDILYRSYILSRDPDYSGDNQSNHAVPSNIDQQRLRTVGSFQTFDTFMLANDFVVMDGIVADMKKGGIGFRNHTLPKDVLLGAEWSENLLWVEPETVCVNNNISLHIQKPFSADIHHHLPELVDDGGFVKIQTGVPYPTFDDEHSETNPQLYERAYKGAILMNHNLYMMLNVSSVSNRTYLGRHFPLNAPFVQYTPGQCRTGPYDSDIPGADLRDFYHPTNASRKLIEYVDMLVKGFGGMDDTNISRISVTGGVVLGAPLKIKSDSTPREDPGSNYTAPIFSCVTALKASVMNVTFFTNGSSDLKNLKVQSATPRSYTNGSLPLWAIEKPDLGFYVPDINPLWGIVDDQYENNNRFWTFRRDHLYLPAGMGTFAGDLLFAEDSAAWGALENILGILMIVPLAGGASSTYYGGDFSRPLSEKWKVLSQAAETIPTMLSLIWTDIAINTVTSRRSQLNADMPSVTTAEDGARQSVPASTLIQVTRYDRMIRYHLHFAIPAIIFLAIYCILLVGAIVLSIMGWSSLAILRSLLNQTSVGRAVLAARYESEDSNVAARIKTMDSKEWVEQYGREDAGIRKNVVYQLVEQERPEIKRNVTVRSASVSSIDHWETR